MNVSQLIDKLKQFDPNSLVLIRGYEGGVDVVNDVYSTHVELNVYNEWYYGKHETTGDTTKPLAVKLGFNESLSNIH